LHNRAGKLILICNIFRQKPPTATVRQLSSDARFLLRTGSVPHGFGPDLDAPLTSGAEWVDKSFRGAKPAELPVDQPTKFRLVVNL